MFFFQNLKKQPNKIKTLLELPSEPVFKGFVVVVLSLGLEVVFVFEFLRNCIYLFHCEGGAYASAHAWISELPSQELFFFFHHVGARN